MVIAGVKSGSSPEEARAILLQAGVKSLQRRAALIPSQTESSTQYPIFRMPISIHLWESLPDNGLIEPYLIGLLSGDTFATVFSKWRIKDGVIMKYSHDARFLRPYNHEIIEKHNAGLVALWLAHLKAKTVTDGVEKR